MDKQPLLILRLIVLNVIKNQSALHYPEMHMKHYSGLITFC